MAFASAPDFSVRVCFVSLPLNLRQLSCLISNMLPNRFAALRDDAGSPMSSVLSTTGPNDLDVSMELANPEEEWMDMQTWISPQDHQSLGDRRAGFDQLESTLIKVESDLGFDKGMAAMRPADVLRSTAHIAEDSMGYPFSDPGGRARSPRFFH